MLTLRLAGRMLLFASSWNTALKVALWDSEFNEQVRGQGSLPCLSASEISGSRNYRFQLQKLRIVLRKKTKLDSSSETDLQNLCQRLKKKSSDIWSLSFFIQSVGCCFCMPKTSLVAQMIKSLSTMQETRVRSLGGEDLLEKEMATHSSILAWKIPWTEEPGRLQSMQLQSVRHNWATSLSLSVCPAQHWTVSRSLERKR